MVQKLDLKWKKNIKFTLITISELMGVSALKNLQRYLKEQLHCSDGSFSTAYTCFFAVNMVFRLFHNQIWICTKPFWRMIIAYFIMIIAQLLLVISQLVTWSPDKNNVWFAILIFVIGGVSQGSFGPNMLNVMQLTSPGARYFAVIGMPIGINIINIFSFMIIEALGKYLEPGKVCVIIYVAVILTILISIIIMFLYVPHDKFIQKRDYEQIPILEEVDVSNSEKTETRYVNIENVENQLTTSIFYFSQAFKHWKEWIPSTHFYHISHIITLFTVTQFNPGITLYSLDPSQTIKVFGMSMKSNYFRSFMSSVGLIADLIYKAGSEYIPLMFPVIAYFFDLVGILMMLSGIPELYIISQVFFHIDTGIINMQATRWIRDVTQGSKWNLVTNSFWLFFADLGNFIASSSQLTLVKAVCVDMREKLSQTSWDPCPYYKSKGAK